MAESISQFSSITLGGSVNWSEGILKVTSGGFFWRSKGEGGKTVNVSATEISAMHWIRIGRLFELKITRKNDVTVKFDGFSEKDQPILASFAQEHFGVPLKSAEVATKGWNWGTLEPQRGALAFFVDSKIDFDIPWASISQAVVNKNELVLEFHQDDTTIQNESLVEMRLYIPPGSATTVGEETDRITAAEQMHKEILAKAEIVGTAGAGICSFVRMQVLTPRGRYDIEMFPSFMKLHGKTYDYKILYSSISRLFLLPKPDNRHVAFVVSLDPPIRQGATVYPHLLLHFLKEDTLEVTINLTKEQIEQKYKDKLEPKMSGPSDEVVCRVFKAITNKKVSAHSTFKSHSGARAVKCSLKADDGYLFPLDKAFFFIHKPPVYIPFNTIESVEFARLSAGASTSSNTRTFDLVVTLKGGAHVFTGIQRQEYSNLFHFITAKKLLIVGANLDAIDRQVAGEEKGTHSDMEDDDEDEDADFVAKEEEEVPEEFDSEAENAAGSGGSDNEAGPSKKRKSPERNDKSREKRHKSSHDHVERTHKIPESEKKSSSSTRIQTEKERNKKESASIAEKDRSSNKADLKQRSSSRKNQEVPELEPIEDSDNEPPPPKRAPPTSNSSRARSSSDQKTEKASRASKPSTTRENSGGRQSKLQMGSNSAEVQPSSSARASRERSSSSTQKSSGGRKSGESRAKESTTKPASTTNKSSNARKPADSKSKEKEPVKPRVSKANPERTKKQSEKSSSSSKASETKRTNR